MGDSIRNPKSINALMKHLRNECGILINGSSEKQQLINHGYYHGYKGYRFFQKRDNIIPYTHFSQILSVINYDTKLKSLLYPGVMFLETATKNIVINSIITDLKEASFDVVYKKKMNDSSNNFKLRLQRMQLKNKIHATLLNAYSPAANHQNSQNSHSTMVSHFYDRGDEVPIWAIFEIISLGDFATMVKCLNQETRKSILMDLNMITSADTANQLLSNILYTVKSLRNAIAHNNVIFDVRFRDRDPNRNVIAWLKEETKIENIEFFALVDYLILICCVLKKIHCDGDIIKTMLFNYEECINEAYEKLNSEIYTKIITTDSRKKLKMLREYILHK